MKTLCTPSFYLLLAFLAAFNLPAEAQLTTLAYTGTIQTYYVPAGVRSIGIGVVGGSGGSCTGGALFTGVNGGYAAGMYGVFTVTPGQTLKVLVGGAGQTAAWCGGGGGGSFVWDSATNTLLIAAGGGGGAGNNNFSTGIPGLNANTGDIAINGNTMPSGAGSGGGGGVYNGAYDYAAAGAGWLSSGHAGYTAVSCGALAMSGFTPLAGGAGGSFGGDAGFDGNGGFGGGGGAQGRCGAVGAGGGGGYSGGGAGGELVASNNILGIIA